MNKYFIKICLIVLISLNISCSTYKTIPYFQDLNRTTITKEAIGNYSALTIQAEDIIAINVSSLNPEASAIFNYNLNRVNGNNNDNTAGNPVVGYLVDQKGEIQLPLIGSMKISGYTTSQLRDELRKKLLTYLKEPVVNIRIINFKVSVLGDVLNPNLYPVQNERITITEALSLAGDLNITAMRTNVMLIREMNGQREYIPVDLTSKDLFTSPYFYLKNNDVLYVQPDRTKYATVDRGFRTATLVLSGLSIIAIVLSNLYR